ncbi:MAG: nuclear transport factor 2 family protein [Steroidobacteraceae bacterium]
MTSLVAGVCLSVVAVGALAADKQPTAAEYTKLLKEVERQNAAIAVQNLMGRYTYYQLADKQVETGELFALKTAGVKVQLPSGNPSVGGDAVKAFYAKSAASQKPEGMFHLHPMQTPVVEVAGDGKTAKGVFLSLGAGANSGDDKGAWTWVRYGADFIKENGVWKIWHLHAYPIFSTSFYKSWTDSAKEKAAGGGKPPMPQGEGGPAGGGAGPQGGAPGAGPQGAGGPPQSSGPEPWSYNGKGLPPLEPVPPTPYETFDPATAY